MSRPRLGTSETKRQQLKITADELKAIDDYRFEHRIPSTSEAIRRLIKIGLEQDSKTGAA